MEQIKSNSGWYVLYDGSPIAGPFNTSDQACRRVSRMRDPECITVEFLDELEKDPE